MGRLANGGWWEEGGGGAGGWGEGVDMYRICCDCNKHWASLPNSLQLNMIVSWLALITAETTQDTLCDHWTLSQLITASAIQYTACDHLKHPTIQLR